MACVYKVNHDIHSEFREQNSVESGNVIQWEHKK